MVEALATTVSRERVVDMKIYIIADFEGVSGVSNYDIYRSDVPGDVEKRRELVDYWVDEINAAVHGSVAAGAEEIVLLDNHSSGVTIPLGRMVEPTQLIHGFGRTTWLPLLDDSFDALLLVGQHAMANTDNGHLCHTYSRRRISRVVLNGREIGEIGLCTGIAGHHGVPLAFVSGDDKAVAEARDLVPDVSTVTVKHGLSVNACLSVPRVDAVRMIRDGVEKGLRAKSVWRPYVFERPLELAVEYRRREFFRAFCKAILRSGSGSLTGIRTLTATGNNLPDLWDRLIGLRS